MALSMASCASLSSTLASAPRARTRRSRTVVRAETAAPSNSGTSSQFTKTPVSVEFQREKAKEMIKFFNKQKEQQVYEQAATFGWTLKNEIGNGRWVMFGLLVGMMTEYATGVSFPEQIRLTISVLGIADVYD